MLSIALGAIFLISSASGRMTLLGTQGCRILGYVGLGLIIFGSFQVVKRRRGETSASELAA